MKSKLAYIVLFSVFGIAAATAAESAGASVAAVAYALPFGAFIISMVLLTLGQDYGRALQPLTGSASSPLLTPAHEAFSDYETIPSRPVTRRRALPRRAPAGLAHR